MKPVKSTHPNGNGVRWILLVEGIPDYIFSFDAESPNTFKGRDVVGRFPAASYIVNAEGRLVFRNPTYRPPGEPFRGVQGS